MQADKFDTVIIASTEGKFIRRNMTRDQLEVDLFQYAKESFNNADKSIPLQSRFCCIPVPRGENLNNLEFLGKFLENMSDMIERMTKDAG